MTQNLCAVGMRNAILRNYLKQVLVLENQSRSEKNFIAHFILLFLVFCVKICLCLLLCLLYVCAVLVNILFWCDCHFVTYNHVSLHYRQWSWYWYSVWQFDHWLCQESIPQATAFLICYSRLCTVWSYGSFLFDDGLFNPVCPVNCIPDQRVIDSCHQF